MLGLKYGSYRGIDGYKQKRSCFWIKCKENIEEHMQP